MSFPGRGGRLEGGKERRYTCGGWEAGGRGGEKVYLWRVGGWREGREGILVEGGRLEGGEERR